MPDEPFAWTEDRIQFLRDTWGKHDWSATKIADAIGHGCTRNGCIGKANRLGLSKLRAQEDALRKARGNARTHRAPPPKIEAPPVVVAPAPPAPPPRPPEPAPVRSSGPVDFLDARPNQCRFPLWSPSERTGLVCGEPVASPGCSWCPGCLKRVAVPRGERRAA